MHDVTEQTRAADPGAYVTEEAAAGSRPRRIDVHYSIDVHVEFPGRDFMVVKASLEVIHELGTDVPGRAEMARNIAERGIGTCDIVDVCGRSIDRDEAARMIRERGVGEGDVRAMRIRRVDVDGVIAARTMD